MVNRYHQWMEDLFDSHKVGEAYLNLLLRHFPIGKKITYLGVEAVVSNVYQERFEHWVDPPIVVINYLNSYGEITNYKMEETEIEFYMRKFEEDQT